MGVDRLEQTTGGRWQRFGLLFQAGPAAGSDEHRRQIAIAGGRSEVGNRLQGGRGVIGNVADHRIGLAHRQRFESGLAMARADTAITLRVQHTGQHE